MPYVQCPMCNAQCGSNPRLDAPCDLARRLHSMVSPAQGSRIEPELQASPYRAVLLILRQSERETRPEAPSGFDNLREMRWNRHSLASPFQLAAMVHTVASTSGCADKIPNPSTRIANIIIVWHSLRVVHIKVLLIVTSHANPPR